LRISFVSIDCLWILAAVLRDSRSTNRWDYADSNGHWRNRYFTCIGSYATCGWTSDYDHCDIIFNLCTVRTADAWYAGSSRVKFATVNPIDVLYDGWYIRHPSTSVFYVYFFIFTLWSFSYPNRCRYLF